MSARHPIPAAVLESHIGIVGKTGSGKSYAAQGIAEVLMDRSERVCIVDPTDRYWGLRLLADGKTPSGYGIAIFGGSHGDLPLAASHGAALAEAVGTTATPTIIATRMMTVGDRTRFFTDFAETLLRTVKGPLHLLIDEAHLFAPQTKVQSVESGKLVHATNNLVSLGRGAGLRIMLLSQRPAKLHKDSLTQVETLVAMRMLAPQDRNAIREWVREWADEKTGAEMMSSLPSLPTGEAWVWAPEHDILKRARFPEIKTWDSGKPVAAGRHGPTLAPIDLEKLKGRFEVVAKEAIENDPRRLKAQVAELQRQLKARPSMAEPEDGKLREENRRLQGDVRGLLAQRKQLVTRLQKIGAIAGEEMPAPPEMVVTPISPKHVRIEPRPFPKTNGSHAPLPRGERAVLIAAAQREDGITREHLTVQTGYKRSSRDAYVARLKERGYVDVGGGGRIYATEEGVSVLGADYEPLPTGAPLREHVLSRLPEGERRILEILVGAYPSPVERQALDDETGYKRSSRDAYVARLKTRELVVVDSGGVRAADELF